MIKFELDKFNRHITNEELLADLGQVASNLKLDSLTQQEYKNNGKFGVSIFINRFGTWVNALAKIGLQSSRHKIKISNEDLIKDLKRVSFELKNDSIIRDEYNRHGKFHSGTLEERFGSWIKAKEKAGLKRREHPKISAEEYFLNLEEVWIKLGKQPHFSNMKIPFSKYSGSGYVSHFGTWRKALEQFIEYINKDEETTINVENSTFIEKKKSSDAPSLKNSNKKLVSKFENKTLSTKIPKLSQVPKNTHQTKRSANDRLRFKIMRRDNFKCKYCGKSPAIDPKIILHVDHIKPWSKGGETTFENLQTLCSACNIGKGNLKQ